jgi:hypothetical protein
MVFSEWKNSDFNVGGSKEQNCQSCHMPKAVGAVKLSSEGGGIARENFSRHTFLGANTFMQSMLKKYSPELGIALEAEEFDKSIARNREFLKSSGSIEVLSSALEGSELVINVKVSNKAGHKLPSGYPSRRAFLHLVVTNTQGEVVFELGKLNADGSIVGVATDIDTETFESHHETISAEEQVQVYEAIMSNSDSAVTHTLLRATHYLKDNRLLPSGFDKVNAHDDIKVAGLAANDANFDAGTDTVVYRVLVPNNAEYNILAELKYQPLSFGHLKDLFNSVADVKEVDQFKTMFDATDGKTETISSTTASFKP